MPEAMPQRQTAAYTLNNGVVIPSLGLGVWRSAPGVETQRAVEKALECGYRHIDTARIYDNEVDVGRAYRHSNLPRADIFITTKLWNDDQGYDKALRAFDESQRRLGVETVDLYLLHWPVARLRKPSWKALERLYDEKRVRAIGVSNFTIRHLEELFGYAKIPPAVNQVEMSPFLYQKALIAFAERHQVKIAAYSPLTRGRKLGDSRLTAMAEKYLKTPAQLLIRWALEHNLVVLPKSVTPERIRENFNVFDFSIQPEDMAVMDTWDEGLRMAWNPESVE
jgi:diketogulonate reductase-like aldo/keto reductase